ncbi:LPS export ABC transporter permease LptG [Thermodesulfobacteriota bacterium]
MKVVTKYISGEFLKLFILCQSIFILLFLVIDFIQRIDNFVKSEANFSLILSFFLFKIPFIAVQMIPVAIMISAIALLCQMKKNYEITAMKTCGLNILQVFQPLIIISFILSIISFILSDVIVPYTSSRSNEIWEIDVENQSPVGFYGNTEIWYKSINKNNFYWIKYYDVKTKTMQNPVFYFLDDQFRSTKRIDSETCVWQDGLWKAKNGVILTRNEDDTYKTEKFNEILLKLPETPETFIRRMKDPEDMSYQQLKILAEKVKAEGYDNTIYLVDLNSKLAFPLINTVLALLAIPIALWRRSGGIPLSITAGIATCFLLYVIMGFSRSLGLAGILPPFLSAWTANILFILIGTNLLMNLEK